MKKITKNKRRKIRRNIKKQDEEKKKIKDENKKIVVIHNDKITRKIFFELKISYPLAKFLEFQGLAILSTTCKSLRNNVNKLFDIYAKRKKKNYTRATFLKQLIWENTCDACGKMLYGEDCYELDDGRKYCYSHNEKAIWECEDCTSVWLMEEEPFVFEEQKTIEGDIFRCRKIVCPRLCDFMCRKCKYASSNEKEFGATTRQLWSDGDVLHWLTISKEIMCTKCIKKLPDYDTYVDEMAVGSKGYYRELYGDVVEWWGIDEGGKFRHGDY